jgi:hypothetical protein
MKKNTKKDCAKTDYFSETGRTFWHDDKSRGCLDHADVIRCHALIHSGVRRHQSQNTQLSASVADEKIIASDERIAIFEPIKGNGRRFVVDVTLEFDVRMRSSDDVTRSLSKPRSGWQNKQNSIIDSSDSF